MPTSKVSLSSFCKSQAQQEINEDYLFNLSEGRSPKFMEALYPYKKRGRGVRIPRDNHFESLPELLEEDEEGYAGKFRQSRFSVFRDMNEFGYNRDRIVKRHKSQEGGR